MTEPLKAHDGEETYCPRLGHHVPFRYCREPGSPIPCRRLVGCWRKRFNVEGYVERCLTEEQRQAMAQPPGDKMVSLAELARRAQRSGDEPR